MYGSIREFLVCVGYNQVEKEQNYTGSMLTSNSQGWSILKWFDNTGI